jgi:hypothetical protein
MDSHSFSGKKGKVTVFCGFICRVVSTFILFQDKEYDRGKYDTRKKKEEEVGKQGVKGKKRKKKEKEKGRGGEGKDPAKNDSFPHFFVLNAGFN